MVKFFPMTKCLRVILIDGDPAFLREASDILTVARYSVNAVSDFAAAENHLRAAKGRAVVVSELSIGGESALAFMVRMLRAYPHAPFTLLASQPPLESVIEALQWGAYDFLRKPVDPGILCHSVARSVEKLNLGIDSEKLEKEVHDKHSRLQTELKKSQLQNAYKGFLISMVGHDFKSILTVLDGYHQILKEKCVACPYPYQKDSMEQTGRTINRLRTMANTLLDYEAAERGDILLHVKKCEINGILEECADFYRSYAIQKKIRLVVESDIPVVTAIGDPDRLMQILDNLVYNAIKFTPPNGEIRLGAGEGEDHTAVFWVEDNGGGIPKSRLGELFKDRRNLSTGNVTARMGLGLNICKKLIEIQNGKIWLDSVPGKGTKVYLSLPV